MKWTQTKPWMFINFNSLWPCDNIWHQRSTSTMVQVMACCLAASNHYLSQCWLYHQQKPLAFIPVNVTWISKISSCVWNLYIRNLEFRNYNHIFHLQGDNELMLILQNKQFIISSEKFLIAWQQALQKQQLKSQYRKVSNIRRAKSQNLSISHLGLQLSLSNMLKPCVQWRMKM